jgi:predicted TIM-barrel fold metal-dependent hydrolase
MPPSQPSLAQSPIRPEAKTGSEPAAREANDSAGRSAAATAAAKDAPAERTGPPPAGDASQFNRIGIDFHQPIARPPVHGWVIDSHTHLLAARHARGWFETAAHFGIDAFITMSPLEEALAIQRDFPSRVHFIAIPQWKDPSIDDWRRRVEAFFNLGSRIVKFHMSPGTMSMRGWRLDSPQVRPVIEDARARGMVLMSHIGDPELWYTKKYTDTAKFGTREEHYRMWESVLESVNGHPWLGAHLGGNPEDLPRLQGLLDRFPNLFLDCSATRWMQREISRQAEAARAFFIRNQDRILFGSDQVSGDDRGFDFLASRWWVHRKLWETDYAGPSPILDPDLPADSQPQLQGLALPAEVLQKIYHDNAIKLLALVGVRFGD